MSNWWDDKVKDVDPTAEVAARSRPVDPNISPAESALRGFITDATFGMAPRISAGINTAIGKLPGQYDEPYSKRLKEYLDADRAAKEANPKASLAGSAIPMAIQAFATGGGSLARQAGVNTAMGAVNAMGGADEGEMLKEGAKGGLTAGVLSAAPVGVGRVLDYGARKFTSGVAAKPLQELLESKPAGWQKQVADLMGDTEQSLTKQFGSVETAATEYIDALKQTGKWDKGTNLQLSDMGSSTQPLFDKTVPTLGQVGKETIKATGEAAVGAATGAGINAALGEKGIDPLSAAGIGAGVNVLRGSNRLAGVGAQKAIMGLGRSAVPETIGAFGAQYNRPLGAANQLISQAGAAEATDSSSFRRLSDYLKGVPEDEKRKQAMQLQSSPEGRAVGNGEAPQQDWWTGRIQ